MIKKKGSAFIIAALVVIAGLIVFFSPRSNDVVPQKPVSTGSGDVLRKSDSRPTAAPSASPSEPVTETVEVELAEARPILGQSIKIREVREKEDDESDMVRNLEFAFRPGINPARLFENNNNVIVRYDQLYKNMVGKGAVTVLLYYEVVRADTNGDGVLSSQDAIEIGVSYPDGSYYTALVSNVDEVFAHEQMPAENALRLTLSLNGKIVERIYSLESKTLIAEEQVE